MHSAKILSPLTDFSNHKITVNNIKQPVILGSYSGGLSIEEITTLPPSVYTTKFVVRKKHINMAERVRRKRAAYKESVQRVNEIVAAKRQKKCSLSFWKYFTKVYRHEETSRKG